MSQTKLEDLENRIKGLEEQFWELTQFIEILMMGHKTERRHKNIFNRMYKKLCKFHSRLLRRGFDK